MANFQDKICNALTFAGLAGVIIFGTVSLWPTQAEATAQPAEVVPTQTPEPEQLPTDTLAEVPMIETPTETKPEKRDTLKAEHADTISHLTDVPLDTALHVKHATRPESPHTNEAAQTENKQKADNHKAETGKTENKQKAQAQQTAPSHN